MAIENVELMHEGFISTARMKLDKETEEADQTRRVNMEKNTANTKKKSRRPNCSSGLQSPPDSPLPKVVDEN